MLSKPIMRPWEYLLKRLALALLVLFGISLITFFIARVLPSDPAAAWVGPRPTAEQIAKAEEFLGLNDPLYIQYYRYISQVLQGNLGTSIKSRQPIVVELRTFLPATLELVTAAMLIAAVIGIPLGVLSGAGRGGILDNTTRLVSIAGVSIPTFWLGLILQLIFFAKLGWLPLGGRISTEVALNDPVTQVTGFYIIDTVITGNWVAFFDALRHLILPAFTLATYAIGLSIRMTRSTMIEILNEKHILAARVNGLPRNTILFKLALKNAIVPTLTVLGLAFVYSLTGDILVEVIFAWPGLGLYVTNAVLSIDFPVIVSVTLLMTMFYLVTNLVIDMLQAALDPRITLS